MQSCQQDKQNKRNKEFESHRNKNEEKAVHPYLTNYLILWYYAFNTTKNYIQ